MNANAIWSRRTLLLLALAGATLVLAAALLLAPARANGGYSESIRIKSGSGDVTRRVKVGLNKSLIVELPRAARDVLVSNPKVADAVVRTQKRSFIVGKDVGETNVFFFDIEGRQIVALEVQVVRDLTTMMNMFRRLLPDSNIHAEAIGDNIVLSGHAANAASADRAANIAAKLLEDPDRKKIVNMIAIQGKEQVALKVTVAEMQRTMLKQLGVNLQAAVQMTTTTVLNLQSVNPFTVAGNPLSTTNAGLDYATPCNFNRGTTALSGQNISLCGVAGVVRALEQNGLLRTLAEPTLTAISGESASFLAGGEFPIPVGQDSDGDIIIEFKPFGVGLSFTPVVLDEGRISLKVSTEVSELTNEGALTLATGGNSAFSLTIPGLKVRRAESTVELPSGGSLILAGLIHEATKQNINGFPGLKNLPVLGALFRSRDFENTETELVVIATPYIVDPVNRGQLARPDEGFAQASDHEVTLMGRLNAVYGLRTGERPRGAYHGDIGFIVK